MKKSISIILVLAMILACLPINAFAAKNDFACSDYTDCTADGSEIYIVTKDGCPIREEPHNKGKIYARAEKGQLIAVKRVFWTIKATRWCEISTDNGKPLYIHIDNCEPHVHSYITLLENNNGFVEYCTVCGVAKAVAEGETATCDFTCVADQAIKGSFSEYNPSFASVMSQIVAGEILGPVADGRDLLGDIMNGEPGWIITMDLVAFLPLIGALKFSDELAILGKTTDKVAGVTKYADELASVTSKTNSTTLGKNMREAFERTGKDRYYDLSDFIYSGKRNVAAHHIVAGGADNKYARDSRALLAYVGIDVNDAENGVFLIQKQEYADVAALHSGRHSDNYYKTVHDRLFNAVGMVNVPENASNSTVVSLYREAVLCELDSIADALMNGDILLN